jgi:hypothetical protein
MPRELIDLTDKTFGKLLVVGLHGSKGAGRNKHQYWLCKCACGKRIKARGDVLRSGKKTECGCNTSRSHFRKSVLIVGGEEKTVEQWARFYGILSRHIYDRLRCGLTVEQAVTIPVGRQGVRIRHNKKRRLANAQ